MLGWGGGKGEGSGFFSLTSFVWFGSVWVGLVWFGFVWLGWAGSCCRSYMFFPAKARSRFRGDC